MKRIGIAGILIAVTVFLLSGCSVNNETVKAAEGGPHTVGAPAGTAAEVHTEPGTETAGPESSPAADPGMRESAAESQPQDGARIDRSDPKAPKTIESTEITAFDCRFSLVDDAEPGILGNHIYHLQAKAENGIPEGSLLVEDTGAERTLHAGEDFLDELYGIVERCHVADLNGHNVEVQGLPPEFGVRLDIAFASGEQIRVHDNEECVLPYNFISEAVKLFEYGTAVTPEVLDLRLEGIHETSEVSGGWAEVTRPVYGFGYLTSDGEPVLPDGYDALNRALEDINDAHRRAADEAWDGFGKALDQQMLYDRTEAFITRADSEVVSFYERSECLDDAEEGDVLKAVTTHNLEAKTGRELSFSDVFRDMEYLPSLLLLEFEQTYPKLAFRDDALEIIRESVESNDGGISFALSYGFVHLFAEEYLLCDEPGMLHASMSYVLNPAQLRRYYMTEPERWILPVDDGTTYWRGDISECFRIRNTFGGLYGDEIIWEVMLNNDPEAAGNYVEPFYGRAPQCWVACISRKYYVYMRIPTGDVSMLTNVYEVQPELVRKITEEPLDMAISMNTPLDPGWLSMDMNLPVLSENAPMYPYAFFRLQEDGMPEMVNGVYELKGPWARLREGGRYNPANRDDAAVSGGMWTLISGQRLRPYQTDLSSFLDFMTDDGRVVRFGISSFGDDMKLDNFGTLDDVFEPDKEDS